MTLQYPQCRDHIVIFIIVAACYTGSLLMVSICTFHSLHSTTGGWDEIQSLQPLISDTELLI